MTTMAPTAVQITDADAVAASIHQPQAFAALFERHFDRIHGYLRARLGPFLADDLAAETFTRAFDARHRFDRSYADARPWLFAIANNLVREHRRGEMRRLRALGRLPPPAAQPLTDEAAIPRLDAAAGGARVVAALASLRAADRDALLLVAWGELTYEEAARAADVPVGTIRSRIHRARSAVRAALNLPVLQESRDE
jgi:RNA polymerase sigma-70 factor (ECF subfamily)